MLTSVSYEEASRAKASYWMYLASATKYVMSQKEFLRAQSLLSSRADNRHLNQAVAFAASTPVQSAWDRDSFAKEIVAEAV